MIEAAAAFLAWLGCALIVLSDARRGLASGLAILTIGFAVLAAATGLPLGAAVVLAGGAIASVLCWRWRPAGWGIMPPGSTARFVLCIAAGLLALWVAASVTTGGGAPLRFAVVLGLGLMATRVLVAREISVAMAAIAGLALALGAAAGLAAGSPGPVPDAVGGLIAAGVLLVPRLGPTGQPTPGPNHREA